MADHIPSAIDSAARQAARAREFGQTPQCAVCLYVGRTAFIRVPRVQLQQHHISGRANDPATTVLLCLNCHAELHENARDAGASLDAPQTVLEKAGAVFRMHAAMRRLMDETEADLATKLSLLDAALNEHAPDWRHLPEAAP